MLIFALLKSEENNPGVIRVLHGAAPVHGQSCKDTWQKGKPEEKKIKLRIIKSLLDSRAGNHSANTKYICEAQGKSLIFKTGKRFEIAGEQPALPFVPAGSDKLCMSHFPSL